MFNIEEGKKSCSLETLLQAAKVASQSIPAAKFSGVGMESLNSVQEQELSHISREIQLGLEDALKDQFVTADGKAKFSGAQTRASKAAALSAAFLAGNTNQLAALDNARMSAGMEAMSDRPKDFLTVGMEAYNNARREQMTAMSVAYNLNASQLSEFAELFVTPVTITPDQFGLRMSAPLFELQDEIKRRTTGEGVYNFGRKNLLKALIHPEILDNEITRVVPIVNAQNAAFFSSTIPARNETLTNGEVVQTAPLLPGVKVEDLIGLSQTAAMLSAGVADQTDELDKSVVLDRLYFSVTDGADTDFLVFDALKTVPSAIFLDNVNGREGQRQVLSMNSTGFSVSPRTKQVDGSDLVALGSITTQKLAVSVKLTASGEVDREFATSQLMNATIEVLRIVDENGVDQIASVAGQAIVNMLKQAKCEGYELDARLTNSNRRQRGKMLNTSSQGFAYSTKLRAPFSVVKPQVQQGGADQLDAANLSNLIFAVRVQADAAIVEALFDHLDWLKKNVAINGNHFDLPAEKCGPAGMMLTKYYEHDTLDFADAMSYSSDKERIEAVQAVFQNRIQSLVYRMIRDSNWKAASMALNGGQYEMPEVRIGCDQVLEQYLMKDGDFRTYGPRLNARLASTQNHRMTNKVIITLAPANSAVDNPLNPGFFLWAPELVTELPSVRGGAHSVELTVQPNWAVHVLTPVMAELDIVNLQKVVESRVPMLFENV